MVGNLALVRRVNTIALIASVLLFTIASTCSGQTAELTIVQKVNFVVGTEYDGGDILHLKVTTTVTVPLEYHAAETFYMYMNLSDDATPANVVMDKSDFRVVAPGASATFSLEDVELVPTMGTPSSYYGYTKVEYFEPFEWITAAYQDYTFLD